MKEETKSKEKYNQPQNRLCHPRKCWEEKQKKKRLLLFSESLKVFDVFRKSNKTWLKATRNFSLFVFPLMENMIGDRLSHAWGKLVA